MTGGRISPRRALATLCAVLFLTFLDNTIVTVTLADIQNRLGPGVTALQWIVDGYMLAFAALMLTGGTLGDLLGRKKVMLAGVAVFCAGSAVAALAGNPDVVIVGRIVMGVGAAASEPGTLSMIRHLYPDRSDRARALGAWAAVSGAALAVGPVLGGVLIGVGSWRDVFWFNLAFGVVVFVAALVALPENSDPAGRRLDLVGLTLGVVAVTAATFGVIHGEVVGFGSAVVVVLFAVAVGAAVAFVVHQRRTVDPVLRLEFFRIPTFTGANVVAFVTNFAVIAVFFFVVLYLVVISDFSGYDVAVQFVSMAVALAAGAGVSAIWVAATGPRWPTVLGCLLAAGGIFGVDAVVGPTVSTWQLAGVLGLAGFGFGLTLVTITASVLTIVPAARSGMAASTVNTFRELGGVFGTAILGAIVNGQLTSHLRNEMAALGLPRDIQSSVVRLVTSGAIQQNRGLVAGYGGGAAKCAASDTGCRVLNAAYDAFYAGLHTALVVSGGMLLATSVVALVTMGRPRPATHEDRGSLTTHELTPG